MAKSKSVSEPVSATTAGPSGPPAPPLVFPGDMVLFGLKGRPALVVRVPDNINGYVNLQVFYDNGEDGVNASPVWMSMVGYSAEPAPNSWRLLE